MNTVALRRLLELHVVEHGISFGRKDLPRFFEQIGLAVHAADSSESGELTKRQRVQAALDATPDSDLPAVAHRLLESARLAPNVRNELQEFLWQDDVGPEIPLKFRHEIARNLPGDDLYEHAGAFDELLAELFLFDTADELFAPGTSLGAKIKKHVHLNTDWSSEYLFEQLGAFSCTSSRFRRLLEGLASPRVRPDESSQRRFVDRINPVLKLCGAELRESGEFGGYPTFSVVALGSRAARPKNLIFASQVKPDIRLRDAINNTIEIVTNEDKVLVYDRPIGLEGLTWCALQDWWSHERGTTSQSEGKRSLLRRLHESLPSSSPPQRLFFETYVRVFWKAFSKLPALLPEVWFHWDPKTTRERGRNALPRFRMDFLMLLPGGARVVLEVDGRHHYADDDGLADPTRYATMVAEDRALRLANYDVYRFGADELKTNDDGTRLLIEDFFRRLFERHGVSLAP